MSDIAKIQNYVNSDAFNDTTDPTNFSNTAISQDERLLKTLERSGSGDSATRQAEEALMGRIDDAQARFQSGSQGIFAGSSDSDMADQLARRMAPSYNAGYQSGYEDGENYGENAFDGQNAYNNAAGVQAYNSAAGEQAFNYAAGERRGFGSGSDESDYSPSNHTGNPTWDADKGGNFSYTVNSDNTHTGDDTGENNLQTNGNDREAVTRPGYSLTGKSDGKNTQEYDGTVNGQHVQVKANGNGQLSAFVNGQEVKPGETKGPVRFEAGGPGGDGIVHITGKDDKTGQVVSSDISKNITQDKAKEGGIAWLTGSYLLGINPKYYKHEGLTLNTHTDTTTGVNPDTTDDNA